MILLLAGCFQTAHADDVMSICHWYGCKATDEVKVSLVERDKLAAMFQKDGNPVEEREDIRAAVQELYLNAGRQSLIYQDKGGNFHDGTSPGRMDCVDHSTNSTTFLNYLAKNGWLKFHRVGKPVYRYPHIIDLHYAALLEEIDNGSKWVVDSWFKDFGQPPEIVGLAEWKKGWRPSEKN